MTPKLFSELGLSAEVLKDIDKLGFEKAAPIQAEAIPVLMSGKDVVGQSQTGSGKPAALPIPDIEKTDPQLRAGQILILCPTRELAVQQIRMEQKALTVPTVEQVFYEVDRRFKIELLTRLIDIHDYKLGIIFCNTKRMVDDLVDHLNAQGYSADRLHGDMSQNMRDRVMNKFRKSGLEFLVATDVAARGIDVDDVEVVFNYDLPYDGEDYVHRIGRTGRRGRSGRAISFASGREVFQIRNIERYTNTRIQRGKPPTADEVGEARSNVFLDKVRATLKSGEFKRQDHFVERLLEESFSSTDIASALLHLLQAGEATPTPKPAREEVSHRSDGDGFREGQGGGHGGRTRQP